MDYPIEYEQEADGRWLAEVPQLPGVLAYGDTRDEAMAKAEALALRVLADQLEHGDARCGNPNPSRRSVSDWPAAEAKRVCPPCIESRGNSATG